MVFIVYDFNITDQDRHMSAMHILRDIPWYKKEVDLKDLSGNLKLIRSTSESRYLDRINTCC